MGTVLSASPITELDREALRARLARHDEFALVMAGHAWAFRAKHIPTSINFKTDQEAFASLGQDDDIVVYCSNVDCNASLALLKKLRDHGYRKLAHYRGGLIDWEEAGLPIEGDWANGAK